MSTTGGFDLTPPHHLDRHPILGALAGTLIGTGVALLLFLYGLVAAGTRAPFVIVVVGALAGLSWGQWGPTRMKGRPPVVGEPSADQRVRQAMAKNEAVIDRAQHESPPPPPLPDLEPPADGDETDWHRS